MLGTTPPSHNRDEMMGGIKAAHSTANPVPIRIAYIEELALVAAARQGSFPNSASVTTTSAATVPEEVSVCSVNSQVT